MCPWRKMRAWGERRLEYLGACYLGAGFIKGSHCVGYTWISKVRTAS